MPTTMPTMPTTTTRTTMPTTMPTMPTTTTTTTMPTTMPKIIMPTTTTTTTTTTTKTTGTRTSTRTRTRIRARARARARRRTRARARRRRSSISISVCGLHTKHRAGGIHELRPARVTTNPQDSNAQHGFTTTAGKTSELHLCLTLETLELLHASCKQRDVGIWVLKNMLGILRHLPVKSSPLFSQLEPGCQQSKLWSKRQQAHSEILYVYINIHIYTYTVYVYCVYSHMVTPLQDRPMSEKNYY